MDWDKKWLVNLGAGKTQLVLFDWSNNTGSIGGKMDGSVLKETSSFKMLELTFSSKLDLDSYISLLLKLPPRKLIRSMKFIPPEVALYLYKSTIQPYMEYCCHVGAGAPNCCYAGLAASLEPLAHCRNVASLSLFYRYCLVDVLQNCLNWFHFLFPEGGLLVILIDYFSVTIPRFYKNVYVNSSFPHTARLWNSLPIECFPLTYDIMALSLELTDTC